MTLLGTLVSVVTLLAGGYMHFLPVSVLYVSAVFPLVLGTAGALVTWFESTAIGESRAAVALLLVLAASLSPSMVSQLSDGSRFDYREALARIREQDPGGTVVLWPLVQATWAAPDLHAIELRPTTDVALFDSLAASKDRFWVITSQRRKGFITDTDGRKHQWLARHCGDVLTTSKPRLDFEQYTTVLWACPTQ